MLHWNIWPPQAPRYGCDCILCIPYSYPPFLISANIITANRYLLDFSSPFNLSATTTSERLKEGSPSGTRLPSSNNGNRVVIALIEVVTGLKSLG